MTPKITVVVMTYNHKNYIRTALDSILAQKVEVDFDILVHDDCSDDGTVDILKEYQHNYPKIVNVIFQKKRQFVLLGYNHLQNCNLNMSPYVTAMIIGWIKINSKSNLILWRIIVSILCAFIHLINLSQMVI